MKNKQRILISILGFSLGGAEIMPVRIANYLKEKQYTVGVHCMQKASEGAIRSLLHSDIPVYCTDRFWKMGMILLQHRYQVIHTHCAASQLLTARVRKRLPFIKIRHVATSHGGYEGMEREHAKKMLQDVDAYVDCWTCVSEMNRILLQESRISEKKVRKIGNAMVAPKEIHAVDWRKYGIPQNAVVFSVITRAVRKKCWRESIMAIKEARELSGENIHLVFCGTGPVLDELQTETLPEFVHFLGAVNNPCDYYAASFGGLLLSVLECAPLGLIEMYNAGIPAIATDTGDIAEMMRCGKEYAGIVLPLTQDGKVPVEEAARAVVKLVQEQKLYEKYCANARQKAAEFSMEHIMEQYLDCYENYNIEEKEYV